MEATEPRPADLGMNRALSRPAPVAMVTRRVVERFSPVCAPGRSAFDGDIVEGGAVEAIRTAGRHAGGTARHRIP
jgi:hypothetical protein